MKWIILQFLFCVHVSWGYQRKNHYRGAVVEYSKVWIEDAESRVNIMRNVDRFVKIMRVSKTKNVDIIVFPELGLMSGNTTEHIQVPEAKEAVTPWRDIKSHEALRHLSGAAHELEMYLVVNLLELSKENETIVYNTDVAFDRNGTIIAKYRKYNLFGEPYATKPERPDYVFFDTDFGSRFGLFTCFDILFEKPAQVLVKEYNVTDIAFPTAWYSELPFLSATQYQAAWSYGTGVNLLASGLNAVEEGHTGSGIYGGKFGPLSYIMLENDDCKLIYHDLPVRGSRAFGKINDGKMLTEKLVEGGACKPSGDSGSRKVLQESLAAYKMKAINPREFRNKLVGGRKEYRLQDALCHGGLCCQFKAKMMVRYRQSGGTIRRLFKAYRLAVFNGVRDFYEQATGGLQVCAILSCLKPHECQQTKGKPAIVFTDLTIDGVFQKDHSFLAPNVFLESHQRTRFGRIPTSNKLKLEKFPRKRDKVRAKLHFGGDRLHGLISASIYSRIFDRDGHPPSRT